MTKLKDVKTWKDFNAETEASNRKLVASWMILEAANLRQKAKNTRYRFEKSGTLSIYAERYSNLLDEMAALFDADAAILMGKDFDSTPPY